MYFAKTEPNMTNSWIALVVTVSVACLVASDIASAVLNTELTGNYREKRQFDTLGGGLVPVGRDRKPKKQKTKRGVQSMDAELDLIGGGEIPMLRDLDTFGGGEIPMKRNFDTFGGGEIPFRRETGKEIIRDLDTFGGGEIPLRRDIDTFGGGEIPLRRDLDTFGGGEIPLRRGLDTVGGGEIPLRRDLDTLGGGEIPYRRDLDTFGGGEIPFRRDLDTVGGGEIPFRRNFDTFGGGEIPFRHDLDTFGGGEIPLRRDLDTFGGGEIPFRRDLDTFGGGEIPFKRYLDTYGGGEIPLRRELDTFGGGEIPMKRALKFVGGEIPFKRDSGSSSSPYHKMLQHWLAEKHQNKAHNVHKIYKRSLRKVAKEDIPLQRNFASAVDQNQLTQATGDLVDHREKEERHNKRNFDSIDQSILGSFKRSSSVVSDSKGKKERERVDARPRLHSNSKKGVSTILKPDWETPHKLKSNEGNDSNPDLLANFRPNSFNGGADMKRFDSIDSNNMFGQFEKRAIRDEDVRSLSGFDSIEHASSLEDFDNDEVHNQPANTTAGLPIM